MKMKTLFTATLIFVAICVNGQVWSPSGSNLYANPISTNIGIGTQSPSSKLHVNGSTGQIPFRVQISGSSKLWVSTNGGVSIGATTTPPDNGLYVGGHIILPSNKVLQFGTAGPTSGMLTIHNASCCYNTYADITGGLYFRNSTPGSFCPFGIQSNGTVIMGGISYDNGFVETNGNLLSVVGGIQCQSITVLNNVPSSDYVFESDYNLRSLSEVETFVRENKHLPEIPSALEIKENGYKLGEMDDLLLRKVEELTLYLIEQNKRIEKLEAENIALKSGTN